MTEKEELIKLRKQVAVLQRQLKFEGYISPFNLGQRHGTEDIGNVFSFRPITKLLWDEFNDYKDGYIKAHVY